MSYDTLQRSLDFVGELKNTENFQRIIITWHGGEPLSLPPEWYSRAHEYIDQYFKQGIDYIAGIQTSMVPYSEHWNELIKQRFASCLGTSIDFSQRRFRGSSSRYINTFLQRVNLARKFGIECRPNIVPTTNEMARPKDFLKWFANNRFRLIFIEPYLIFGGARTVDQPSNLQYAQFLIQLFDLTMSKAASEGLAAIPLISPLVSAINVAVNHVPSGRWGTTCQRDFIVIEPNGNTNTCPDRTAKEPAFSNIHNGLSEFRTSSQRRTWIFTASHAHKAPHCLNCEFATACQSGCPITPNPKTLGASNECSGYKSLLLHIQEYAQHGADNRRLLMNYVKEYFDYDFANDNGGYSD